MNWQDAQEAMQNNKSVTRDDKRCLSNEGGKVVVRFALPSRSFMPRMPYKSTPEDEVALDWHIWEE